MCVRGESAEREAHHLPLQCTLVSRTHVSGMKISCANPLASARRLFMLEGQCASWPGPMSAVIHVTLELFSRGNGAALAAARARVADLHARLEARRHAALALAGTGDSPPTPGCIPDIVLISEVLRPADAWSYPYNALRNQSIARARTKLVLLLDVDFVVRCGRRAVVWSSAAPFHGMGSAWGMRGSGCQGTCTLCMLGVHSSAGHTASLPPVPPIAPASIAACISAGMPCSTTRWWSATPSFSPPLRRGRGRSWRLGLRSPTAPPVVGGELGGGGSPHVRGWLRVGDGA